METENMIMCDLCNEYYDFRLLRCYQYTSMTIGDENGELVTYSACEDCVVNHKKNKWNLGEEILFQK